MISIRKIAEDLQIEHPSVLQVADYLKDSGVSEDTYVSYDNYEDADDADEQADD